MPNELVPIIYWLTQESPVDYGDTLLALVDGLRRTAKRVLARDTREDWSGANADGLIALAMMELQSRILDQYLPEVTASGQRSVGRMWPWWEHIKIRYGKDHIYTWTRLPDKDGETREQLPDGEYRFKFYRNDDRSARTRLLHQIIKEGVFRERKFAFNNVPFQEHFDPPDSRVPIPKIVELKEFVKVLRSIVDSDDLRLADEPGHDESDAERQGRARAMRVLRVACYLINRCDRDRVASVYIARLEKAPDGKRGRILREYYNYHRPILPERWSE
jgi:hypothetical protein